MPPADAALKSRLIERAHALGLQALGVTGIELDAQDIAEYQRWLQRGHHGEMDYMARHGEKRWRPELLVPGTLRVISARMDYWPGAAAEPWSVLTDAELGYVSRYALGRDYHKLLRRRLQQLCEWLQGEVGALGYRVFVDSAPVLERALARNAGLGWIGKHSNLIDRRSGSWFFLGEIYTDLPLAIDPPASAHCGSCSRCLPACPTGAIIAPYQVDARRCISYLTIELQGSIDPALRPLIGNRIYGCDDCQLVCPWNKFARPSVEGDFAVRHQLDAARLIDLFSWEEAEFLQRTEGSPIRRIGWLRWLRNVAVALGNSPPSEAVRQALLARRQHPSELVREHVEWALARQAEAAAEAAAGRR